MIQHITHIFEGLETLVSEMWSGKIARATENSQVQLVQIYCAEANRAQISAITLAIKTILPSAVVVGATTVGEVAHGRLMTSQTIIGFTCFESSNVDVFATECSNGDEHNVGAELGQRISDNTTNAVGMLLLSTPLSIDASSLLQGIESTLGDFPVFGGGAGDYAAMKNSLVFTDADQFSKGAVAVVFSGDDLHIEANTYLGWRPLSRSMQVTEVGGLSVKRVDDEPAFEVYRRYLNLPADDQFFVNALEFPFLLERDGQLLARVPVAVDEHGALQFVADIREGEHFRIGYGDIDLVTEDAKQLHDVMVQFDPQVIFLYTCGCRRFLMQEDVDLETQPFEAVAPTFGFYTYGEFFGSSSLSLLNSTMVAIGLREGEKVQRDQRDTRQLPISSPDERDPYANKHARVVSKLLRFIDVVTSELEASMHEITKLSITDRLTQLVNRIRLDRVLDEQIEIANRYQTPFAIILLDVDHFKQVNDTHGHLVGDDVLVRLAQILMTNTRSVDVVGRWGGEEFLIIAPNTSIDEAAIFAEKLRLALAGTEFPVVGYKTGSFGVTGFVPGDNLGTLVARADAALYIAKKAGRNQVKVDQVT